MSSFILDYLADFTIFQLIQCSILEYFLPKPMKNLFIKANFFYWCFFFANVNMGFAIVRIINVMIFWKGNLNQKTIYILSLWLLFTEGL